MDRSSIHVLLVDDEISLIEAMQKILTFEGFTVTIATSGKAALELCRTHPFQIVFLDVNMPDLNGLETFKAMRTIIPGVPVVMITGYGRSLRHLIEEARQLGVRACIDKPFKINQILETIRAVLPSVD